MKKYFYSFLKYQDYFLNLLSCKAMRWRGYSQYSIHPKHLFDEHRSEYLHSLFRSGMKFLDIGSGVGTDCLLAAKQGAVTVIGIEKSNSSLLIASERKYLQKMEGVCFIQVDLEEGSLPFTENFFDLVNFSNVLEHLDNRHSILAELKRVKKQDGLAVISVPNADTAWKKKQTAAGLDSRDDSDHKIEYSKQSLIEEMQAAGLEICSDLMPIIPSWPWNGLIAISAAISPLLYRKMQRIKRNFVEKHPDQSVGWVFVSR